MNLLLWLVQIVLALLCLAGGAYKVFAFDEIANQMTALSRGTWSAFGVFEMACAVLLVIPAATKWRPSLTPLAAAALAVEALVLAAVYANYSLALTATNPLVWSVAIGLMAAFVAYGRLRPSALRTPPASRVK